MLGSYSYGNNVQTTLNTGISDSATTVLIDEATAPFNDPPTDASATKPARFTLMDDPAAPTVIEIIQATGVSAPVAGVVTLTGVTRGLEGTAAQAWGSGNAVLQNVTQAMLNPPIFAGIVADSFSGVWFNSIASWNYNFAMPVSGGNFIFNKDGATCYFNMTGARIESLSAVEIVAQTFDVVGSASVGANFSVVGLATFAIGGVRIALGAPASSAATGQAGQIRLDANYIYICTATNTWKRVALSTF